MTKPVQTAETLMHDAIEGRLPKQALAGLLALQTRQAFLTICADIEKAYTKICSTSGAPCLESGCSCEDETCLEPLQRAGAEYHRACGAQFAALFAVGANRDAAWRLTASGYDTEAVLAVAPLAR
jgi:hypothetical protein